MIITGTRTSNRTESLETLVDSLPESTDDVLVAAAATGDENAFEQLFERHRRQVARIAGRFFAQREQIKKSSMSAR